MLSQKELKQKIETTSLPEAITLFKEQVLSKQLSHYIPSYKEKIKNDFDAIDYSGAFFFFVEPNLGSSRGGVSDAICDDLEKVALLLLLVEAYERYVDVNTGIEDWLGYDCIFCDFVVSNEAAARPLTQEEYEFIRDLIIMVVDNFLPSMTVMETQEYEQFKTGNSPDTTTIDNIQITLPLGSS
ncbi:TPA: hypothetical protein VBN11_001564 [Streptococcus agalactiae]|nr:hypothetical protein [Streptococcus agalactiae]